MKARNFSKGVGLLCLLLLTIVVLSYVKSGVVVGQSSEHGDVTITLRPVTPVIENLTPKDFKFQLDYVISSFFLNDNDNVVNLTIPQGMLGWSYGNNSIYNVEISDSLGNHFSPIIEDSKVSNPDAQVIVQPRSEYRISLSFSTDYGIIFDEEKLLYGLVFNAMFGSPNTLFVCFPKDFTILEHTPNATRTEDSQFIILEWQQNTVFDIFVTFVPFHLEATIRSFTFTLDVPTVTPIGFVKGTYEETFTAPTAFSIWPINPLFAVGISFPEYGQILNVSKVWDGTGTCSPLTLEPKKLDDTSLGHYYVDNANRKVIVYPRHDYKGDYYQYAVGATFVFPPEYKPFEMKAVKELTLPYQYESYFIIDKVFAPVNWKMNITGNVEIKFLLPVGTQILKEESGNPEVGVDEDGRTTGLFVYNSPSTLSPSGWHVIYEMTNQRNLFWLEVITFLLFGIASVLLFILPPKILQHLVPVLGLVSVFTALMIVNITQFININWSKPVFLYLLASETGLFLAFVIILSWKSWNDFKHQKANQCPNCGNTGLYVKSRLTRERFIKEYKCSDCGEIYLQQMSWKPSDQYHVCESCGKNMRRIYQIQTGQFKNEKRKQVEVQVKCPNCGRLTWTRIQIAIKR